MADGKTKKIRVLIVEDSTFMRKVLQGIIASDPQMEVAGHAKDGREAVAMAESLKPDVIAMDINMPRMDGLALLREGRSAEEVVASLTAADEGRAERQVGVVDAHGRAATFTGEACHDWAGGRTGNGYAAQGNILVSQETVDALTLTFEQNGHLTLAQRLIDCLAAAQAAGGDRRGQQSASLLVVEKDAGYAHLSDVVVDLRVDDHELPIVELRRLYALHNELFGITPSL